MIALLCEARSFEVNFAAAAKHRCREDWLPPTPLTLLFRWGSAPRLIATAPGAISTAKKKRGLLTVASAATVMTLGGVGYAARRRGKKSLLPGSEERSLRRVALPRAGPAARQGSVRSRPVAHEGHAGGVAAQLSQPIPAGQAAAAGSKGFAWSYRACELPVQIAGRTSSSIRSSPSGEPGPLRRPKRVNPPGIVYGDLPPIDAVLITHNHFDHLDGPVMARLWQDHQPLIVAPLGNDAILRSYDDTMHVETAMGWNGRSRRRHHRTSDAGPSLVGAGLNDRRMALWCAFLSPRRGASITMSAIPVSATGPSSARSAPGSDRRASRPADRRLRAALVHAASAHEPRRRRGGFYSARGRSSARSSLGHLPPHDEGIERRWRRSQRRSRQPDCRRRDSWPASRSGVGRVAHRTRAARA